MIATLDIDGVLAAKYPVDLFGSNPELDEVKRAYRRAAKELHPDVNSDPRAEQAMKRLSDLYIKALHQLTTGDYGMPTWEAVTRRGVHYEFWERPEWQGDSTDIFLGGQHERPVYVKVARSSRDNGLLANERSAIKCVRESDTARERHAHLYVADWIDSFSLRVGTNKHQANVFSNEIISFRFQDLMRYFPNGVHPKDAAWMFRRLLWGLGCAHEAGVVHAAVLPVHLLFVPAEHGMVLIDWRAAATDKKPIALLSSGYRDWYPNEVLERKSSRPEFDIAMAAACMEWVCGGASKLPRPLRGFYRGCRAKRLPSAFELRDEYTALIEAMWGSRKFRPFIMPDTQGTVK